MVAEIQAVRLDPSALKKVETLFNQQIEKGLHSGAAMAVYHQGQLVLDLYGGVADKEAKRPVTRDTLFILFSSTKPLAAACLWILWERGLLEWGNAVEEYWPEFGHNGKEHITLRQVLSHTAGLPETPAELTWDKWKDWSTVLKALENATPTLAPGEAIAYHSLNYGWIVGELVRRIDGRPIDQFLREEITSKLGMKDTYLGLPANLERRVAKLYAMPDADRPELVEIFNRPQVHQAVLPAGNGIATARDLARFYGMLSCRGSLDGTRLLTSTTITGIIATQARGEDRTLGKPSNWALGLAINDPRMGNSGQRRPRIFGHGGAGTSIGWADIPSRLGVAIITNGFRGDPANTERLTALSQAVWDACR